MAWVLLDPTRSSSTLLSPGKGPTWLRKVVTHIDLALIPLVMGSQSNSLNYWEDNWTMLITYVEPLLLIIMELWHSTTLRNYAFWNIFQIWKFNIFPQISASSKVHLCKIRNRLMFENLIVNVVNVKYSYKYKWRTDQEHAATSFTWLVSPAWASS